jgi:hypothetical protein
MKRLVLLVAVAVAAASVGVTREALAGACPA